MIIISAPKPGSSGVAPNLVVTTDQWPRDAPDDPRARLSAFVERQTGEMRANLAGFQLESLQPWAIGQYPASELLVRWRAPQALLSQWVCFVYVDAVTVLIATGTAAAEDMPDSRPQFRAAVESLRKE